MEAIKIRLKPIALFLTALLLFQSCVVYHKTPTTLAQASRERVQTKTISTNRTIAKFRYIDYVDNQYYGMSLKSGEWIKTPLYQQDMAQVLTKNRSASTWLTVGVIAVPVILVLVIATADIGPDFGGSGEWLD